MSRPRRQRASSTRDVDRPRVHPDVDPNALELDWAKPKPPKHVGDERLIKMKPEVDAERINGVWVNPDETAWVRTSEAKRLVAKGKASAAG